MNIMRLVLLFLLLCFIVPSQSQLMQLAKEIIDKIPEKIGKAVSGPHKECKMKYELLDPRNIEETRKEIMNCKNTDVDCHDAGRSKFRTPDGTCNNLKNPTWGKSDLCLRRILPFDYSDNVSQPRKSCAGKTLPNPRLVSILLHHEPSPIHAEFTTHFMEWGQMVTHDVSRNDINRQQGDSNGPREPIPCCDSGPHISDSCYSMPVPTNDPFYPSIGVECLNFVRSIPCNCSASKRVHWNQNTGYQDLSLIYGSNEEDAKSLRNGEGGMLAFEYNEQSGPMPKRVYAEDQCISQSGENDCYKTGDPRANQNLSILTTQIYLMRHHNLICEELSEINPHWDDERIYQEARRINIAIVQYITYGRYLPYVLGEVMQAVGIEIQPGAKYTQYNPELDASILDEFTTFAGRYGHSVVNGRITEIDPVTEERNEIRMRDYFFRPFGFKDGQFEKIVKGMTEDRMYKFDVYLTDDVRNYLYRRLYMTFPNQTNGSDLASLNVMRGRDHGIPAYTYYQRYFFNRSITSFDNLRKILLPKKVDLLETLYESVHDVDTFSAGLAECHVRGGIVGPTFGSVLGEQYRRLKFGDRYWFEHEGQTGSFTPEQLVEIKKMSLASILCETTEMGKIQREPFLPASENNPVVSCNQIHRFDFDLWRE